MTIEGSTREQEPGTLSDDLRSGRDAGIGRVETEMVRALDGVCVFTEFAGQGYEVSSTASDGDGAAQRSSRLRGQCRRDEEASPFEVEEWVHVLRIYALRKTVVDSVRDNFSALYCRGGCA